MPPNTFRTFAPRFANSARPAGMGGNLTAATGGVKPSPGLGMGGTGGTRGNPIRTGGLGGGGLTGAGGGLGAIRNLLAGGGQGTLAAGGGFGQFGGATQGQLGPGDRIAALINSGNPNISALLTQFGQGHHFGPGGGGGQTMLGGAGAGGGVGLGGLGSLAGGGLAGGESAPPDSRLLAALQMGLGSFGQGSLQAGGARRTKPPGGRAAGTRGPGAPGRGARGGGTASRATTAEVPGGVMAVPDAPTGGTFGAATTRRGMGPGAVRPTGATAAIPPTTPSPVRTPSTQSTNNDLAYNMGGLAALAAQTAGNASIDAEIARISGMSLGGGSGRGGGGGGGGGGNGAALALANRLADLKNQQHGVDVDLFKQQLGDIPELRNLAKLSYLYDRSDLLTRQKLDGLIAQRDQGDWMSDATARGARGAAGTNNRLETMLKEAGMTDTRYKQMLNALHVGYEGKLKDIDAEGAKTFGNLRQMLIQMEIEKEQAKSAGLGGGGGGGGNPFDSLTSFMRQQAISNQIAALNQQRAGFDSAGFANEFAARYQQDPNTAWAWLDSTGVDSDAMRRWFFQLSHPAQQMSGYQ